jgi:hypothetical protein
MRSPVPGIAALVVAGILLIVIQMNEGKRHSHSFLMKANHEHQSKKIERYTGRARDPRIRLKQIRTETGEGLDEYLTRLEARLRILERHHAPGVAYTPAVGLDVTHINDTMPGYEINDSTGDIHLVYSNADAWPPCGDTPITWIDTRTGNAFIQPACTSVEPSR